jgi:hypothetical protein
VRLKILLTLALVLLPGVASASVSMQYICYDSFDETVAAFQRLALIVSDNVYLVLAMVLACGSMLMASGHFATEGIAGRQGSAQLLIVQMFLGMMFFCGAVLPKGTIYVYDETLNKNQAVGGIPEIIVFFAGGLNVLEREMTRVVDTAAATPFTADIGSASYSVIFSAATSNQGDADLERTIGQYVMDCGLTSVDTGNNGASLNELLRSSTDLRDTLSEYTHPAWPTTYYPSGTPGGVPGTCADSWNYLKGVLDNAGGGQVADLRTRVCTQAGYDVTDAAQSARCDSVTLEAAKLFGVAPATSSVFLRNFVVSKGIQNMLLRPDFTPAQGMLVNRQMIAEGAGTTEALNEWVPRLRAMMLALVLGIIPIPLLFIITHLVKPAIGLVLGMFAFLALWGMSDAVAVQMARDAAATAFAVIQKQHMGFEALMLAPPAAVKSLALFGKYRMMAFGMATLISAALFKMSFHAFSTAEAAAGDIANKGGQAGQNTMTGEGLQRTLNEQMNSTSAAGQLATVGAGNAMSAAARNGIVDGMTQADYVGNAGAVGGRPGQGMSDLYSGMANRRSGGEMGANRALSEVSAGLGMSPVGASTEAARVSGVERDASAIERGRSANEIWGPEGLVSGAKQSGAATTAGLEADRETARLFNKGPGEGLDAQVALAQQKGAQTWGAVTASGGDVGKERDKRTVQEQQSLGRAEALGGAGSGNGLRVGQAEGRESLATTGAQEKVLAAFGQNGQKAFEQSKELPLAQSFGASSAAAQSGGVISSGIKLGHQQLAGGLGNANVREAAARAIMGDGMSNRVKFEEAANGNLQATLTGDNLQRAVDSAVTHGGMNPSTAAAILKKGAGRMEFGFNKDQGIVTGTLSGQFKSYTGSYAVNEDGSMSRVGDETTTIQSRQDIRRDTVEVDDSRRVVGGTGFTLKQGETAQQLLRAYNGDFSRGVADVGLKNAIVTSYVESLGEYGHNVSASHSKAEVDQWGVGGKAGLGLGGAGSGSPASIGISADAGIQQNRQTSSQTSTNAANTYFRGVLDQSISDGQKRAAEIHPGDKEAQNEYVAKYAEVRMTAALTTLRASSDADVSTALGRSNAVGDSNDANRATSATGIQEKHASDQSWQQHAADVSRAKLDGPKL